MSGHSHWATIRRKKGAKDAKRGKLYSKLAKGITLAARDGRDLTANFKLKCAVDQARSHGLPRDNIERAIRRGTGEEEGVTLEEVLYEGVGHEGVQILVDALTDNRNRTTAELRKLFEKKGGKMSTPNSVAWNFETKGHITLPVDAVEEEELFELVVEAGADSLDTGGEGADSFYEILCAPEDLDGIRKALEGRGLAMTTFEIARFSKTTVKIESGAVAGKIIALIGELEEHDDVQSVSASFEIPDDIMAQLDE